MSRAVPTRAPGSPRLRPGTLLAAAIFALAYAGAFAIILAPKGQFTAAPAATVPAAAPLTGR